ncbi:asparagine synthase-related protein [Lysobacter terrae]
MPRPIARIADDGRDDAVATASDSFAGARRDDARHEQIETSPYAGTPDLSSLASRRAGRIDVVSVADLLRNSFVYPPHSILEEVKLVTPGFDAKTDMRAAPNFRFLFRDRDRNRHQDGDAQDWVGTYHRLLCDAVTESCVDMRAPWLLQSGGKDSTTLAIAAAEARPDTVCITYLGGREEDEVASARLIAQTLGLRHESLVCDPGRAYDRYVAIAPQMPLLTADFALLSYVDLATEIAAGGGDGVIDGLGSDWYFGMALQHQQRVLAALARGLRLPFALTELPLVDRSFLACFVLSSLEMTRVERLFPGSRFSDAEVDELLGREVSHLSRGRLATFQTELESAETPNEWRAMVASISGGAAAFAKGLYTLDAMGLRAAYPFCNTRLREWVHREVPRELLLDPTTNDNKVLVRQHIATRFNDLPYVSRKGSFRFDLRGLAKARFEQVHALAEQASALLPGAARWLERNRHRLDNKYHASKFYLLAVILPWVIARGNDARQFP